MINYAVLQGRLTRDPELLTTQSGTSVCSFTVANSKKYKDNENKLFLQCTAWRGIGEFVSNYFHKGQEIIVAGELWSRDWEDREGNKRTSIELTVSEASFCGPKDSGGAEGCNSVPTGTGAPVDVTMDDIDDDGDLPF